MLPAALEKGIHHKIPAMAAKALRLVFLEHVHHAGSIAAVEYFRSVFLLERDFGLRPIDVATGGTGESLAHLLESLVVRLPFQEAFPTTGSANNFNTHRPHI